MSKVLRAVTADSLGSFIVQRGSEPFRPWTGSGTPQPGNDFGEAPLNAEEEALRLQAEAYALGYEEGRQASEQELGAEREALSRLIASLDVLKPEPTNALALLLAETVDRLVREIVGEVEVDATLLLSRARAAAALIGENTEPSRLRAHPEDLCLLAGNDLPVELAADPSLARGTIRLDTGHGWIEDGPQIRLERLRAELDRMAAAR